MITKVQVKGWTGYNIEIDQDADIDADFPAYVTTGGRRTIPAGTRVRVIRAARDPQTLEQRRRFVEAEFAEDVFAYAWMDRHHLADETIAGDKLAEWIRATPEPFSVPPEDVFAAGAQAGAQLMLDAIFRIAEDYDFASHSQIVEELKALTTELIKAK